MYLYEYLCYKHYAIRCGFADKSMKGHALLNKTVFMNTTNTQPEKRSNALNKSKHQICRHKKKIVKYNMYIVYIQIIIGSISIKYVVVVVIWIATAKVEWNSLMLPYIRTRGTSSPSNSVFCSLISNKRKTYGFVLILLLKS